MCPVRSPSARRAAAGPAGTSGSWAGTRRRIRGGGSSASTRATWALAQSGTPRDREGDWIGMRDFHNPGWFAYARYAPQDLLVVLIVMSYACMAPLILLPGMLFFGVASVVYRHQFLFVYIEDEKRNKDGTRSRMVTIEMPPSNQLLHAEPVEEILATRSRRASCYFSKQVEQTA